MTSGVKQALPQVLMPTSEGKAARSRAPQGDFAEALGLGKFAGQLKSGEAKAEHRDVEAGSALPRLTAKLETVIDRTQGIGSKLEVAVGKPKEEGPADSESAAGKDTGLTDSPTPAAITRHSADPVQAPAAAPAPATGTEQAGSSKTQPASANHRELSATLAHDAVAHDAGDPDEPAAAPNKPVALKGDPAPPFVPMGGSLQGEHIRFEPASKPLPASAEPPLTEAAEAKETQPDNFAEPAKNAPRVTVLSQQSIPAPIPSTAVVLVESIAASDLLQPARTVLAPEAIHASATHASAQSLKIQLHPAELGMVTATLRFAGEQLSIELQVENHEAYRRLSSDSEAIVKSLRDIGYDIERVSVLQPSIVSSATARSEGSAMQASPGRAGDQFGAGTAGGGDSGGSGRQPGTDGGNAGRGGQQHSPTKAEQVTGSGVYI